MRFRPKDQIVLLAGLEGEDVRTQVWTLPELRASVERLNEAGLISDHSVLAPSGVAAARGLHHITLHDLVAEHLPERA
jgi:hypothetical protein